MRDAPHSENKAHRPGDSGCGGSGAYIDGTSQLDIWCRGWPVLGGYSGLT